MNYKEQIKRIEDIFFDKNNPRYADISLFSEIFEILDTPEFKEKEPEIYEAELKRIRDLHNSFVTAYEEGFEEGFEEGKKEIEIAKKMILKGMERSLISEMTGLTKEEIEALKEKQ